MPYERTWETRTDESVPYFIVRLREIPRVAGDGLSKDEALKHFRAAFDDYFSWAIDEQLEIPVPSRPVPPRGEAVTGEWVRAVPVGFSSSSLSPEAPPLSVATGLAEPSTDHIFEMARV